MSNRLLPFTEERLLDVLRSLPRSNSCFVGFSGGADSSALLYALCQLKNQYSTPIKAIHVNHGIHVDADLWQEQCKEFCEQLGVELVCLEIRLQGDTGSGQEAEARHLRYKAISEFLNQDDCLLTAHHADDQAETLFLNLMRGSGVDGLSAMPQTRILGKGLLHRPLLGFENAALIEYLKENNVAWLEDPSNQELQHDRNFLRHQVMPLLESRWQGVSQRLLLSRNAMAETRSLLERVADEHLQHYLCHPYVLQIAADLNKDQALFKLVIRRWLQQRGVPSIPLRSLEALNTQIRQSDSENKVCVQWGDCSLRYHQDQLWLLNRIEIQPCPDREWPAGQAAIHLGDELGELMLEGASMGGPPGAFAVRNRKTCQTNSIRQGKHHKSLKNLFQSAGIPDWLRDYIPLCELQGEVVAIGNWCFDDHFAKWMSENNVNLSWSPKNPLLQFVVSQQS
jgi:tRNA(Ile)-lysidine synthase